MTPGFDVVVEYDAAEVHGDADERIRAAAGRESHYSGCGLREGMTRDIGWSLETSEEAIALRQRILANYEGYPPINVCVKER